MWIDECSRKIKPGLQRIEKIKNFFHQDFRVIHVAGTNGKGSVCNFIHSVLSLKYKVGLYTSPHLERVNERIKINGKEIEDEEIERYSWLSRYNFTYFEALTAVALKYFEGNVEYAVIEAGMGGRLDATNIVEPHLTIITNVSLDHTQWLGKSVEEIAKEKAGIIKHAPLVTACKGKSLDVVRRVAEKKGVALYIEGRDFKWHRRRDAFIIEADEKYVIKPRMNALYQGVNIAIAVKSLELLGMEKEDIIYGIENAEMAGRMERIGKFIIDGAHNPDGIKAFVESVKEMKIEPVVIFGAMKDKDICSMIKLLPWKNIILTKAKNERAMPPQKIAKLCGDAIISKDIEDAIEIADKIGEYVAIIGSLYLAGEARRYLKSKRKYFKSRNQIKKKGSKRNLKSKNID